VFSDIEAAALENEPGAAGNNSFDMPAAFGAFGQGRGRNTLEFFKRVAAIIAEILICRHSPNLLLYSVMSFQYHEAMAYVRSCANVTNALVNRRQPLSRRSGLTA